MIRLLLALGFLALGVACASTPPPSLQVAEIDRVVQAWLRCDECWNREIQHVYELGDQAVPVLKGYFDGTRLLYTDTQLEAMYKQSYLAMKNRLNFRTIPLTESESAYVQRRIDRHRDRVRLRAAAAIALIDVSELPPSGTGWRRVRRVYSAVDRG